MGYHAIGIGDDDLSLGKEFLIELSKTSNVPFLSSNLIDQGSGKTPFQRYLLKEVNGLKIGIFSLLSPETFIGATDPRKKGLIFQDPIETAKEIVNELGPKTDLLVLLSHLSYPRDVELVQRISEIHIIAGSHSGINLANAPVFKNTIILQNASKGMYAAKLDLTFVNSKASFYNIATKRSLQTNLGKIKNQLDSVVNAPEAEKVQWRRAQESTEQALQQLEGKNYFTHTVSPLNESIKDHPDIKKMIDDYKSKFPEKSEPPIHDSRETYRPKPH